MTASPNDQQRLASLTCLLRRYFAAKEKFFLSDQYELERQIKSQIGGTPPALTGPTTFPLAVKVSDK